MADNEISPEELTALFLQVAREPDYHGGLHGRLISYVFALVYEDIETERLSIANEACDLMKGV